MYTAIVNALSADGTLTGLLTGGIHSGIVEINRQLAPDAFDSGGEILPCALVKPGQTIPFGPFVHSASQTVEIYLYQRRGVDVIHAAARRIYTLLHDQRLQPVNEYGSWPLKQIFSNIGLEDNALNCSLAMVRYQALITVVEA